jgi:integrase
MPYLYRNNVKQGQAMKTKNENLWKRNGRYYLVQVENGKRTVLSLHTKNELEARKRRDEVLNPALQAKTTERVAQNIGEARKLLTNVDKKYPLAIVWKQYLKNSDRPKSGKGSLENYERYLKAFFKWLEEKHPHIEKVNQVTSDEADQYLEHFWTSNNISHTTWNHHLQGLKLVFKYIIGNKTTKYSTATPFSHIKKRTGIQVTRKDFTPENLEAIFNAFDDDKLKIPDKAEMKLLCYILAFTGLRLSDAVFLKGRNFDFHKRMISCYPLKTRGSQVQVHIPLHHELKAQLDLAESLNNDGYILPKLAAKHKYQKNENSKKRNDVIVTDFLRILDHVGLKDVEEAERGINRRSYGLHSFRHGFASMAANAGVSIAVLSDILGDRIATLQKYYIKVSDKAKMQAVNSIKIIGDTPTQKAIPAVIDVKAIEEPSGLEKRIADAIAAINRAGDKIQSELKVELLGILGK